MHGKHYAEDAPLMVTAPRGMRCWGLSRAMSVHDQRVNGLMSSRCCARCLRDAGVRCTVDAPPTGADMQDHTAEDFAASYDLFVEFIDPDAVVCTTREEFFAMSMDDRVKLAQEVMDMNQN